MQREENIREAAKWKEELDRQLRRQREEADRR